MEIQHVAGKQQQLPHGRNGTYAGGGLTRLDQAINNLLVFNANVRKEFVSNTASQLLENTHAEQVGSSTVQPSGMPDENMQNGALLISNNSLKQN